MDGRTGERADRSRPWRSAAELSARRAALRGRQRRRYRFATAGALAGAAAVGVVALVLVGAGQGRPRHGPALAGHIAAGTGAAPRAPTSSARDTSEPEINRRVLSYTSYIALGTPHERDLALTFDDGPSPFTPRVLAVLKRLHAKATFFEIGRNVRAYQRYTAELAAAGMVIGDHTQEHPPMSQLPTAEQAAEIDRAASAIHAADAPRPLLFRPPYGSFDATTLRLLRERDMVMVLWTVDTSDYESPGVKKIVYLALSGARPGAIILFHDGGGDRRQTVAALPRIIKRLRQRGYRLVTVPELLRDDPPPVGQSPPVSLAGD